jgi:hypothetical protein
MSRIGARSVEIARYTYMSREGIAVREGSFGDTWRTFHVVSGWFARVYEIAQ